MAALRTIFALLIATSLAILPVAGAAAFKMQPQESSEISASEPAHDCCPPGANQCDRAAGDGAMASCALPCCIYSNDVASPLIYPPMVAELTASLPSEALSSQLGSPPFRPPRV